MKKIYFLLAFSLSLVFAQQPTSAYNTERALRISYSFRERAICAHTFGGNTYMFGYTIACAGTSCTHASAMVVVNGKGEYQWSRRIGNGQAITPNSSTADANGNAYMAGKMKPVPFGNDRIVVYKLDTLGNVGWCSMYGIDETHTSTKILIHNNAIYVCGFSYNVGDKTAFLLKLDMNGNQLWLKYYSHPPYDVSFVDMYLDSESKLQVGVALYDWFGPSFVSGVYAYDLDGNNLSRFAIDGFHDLVAINANSDGSVSGMINQSNINKQLGTVFFKTNAQKTALAWLRKSGVYATGTDAVRGVNDALVFSGVHGSGTQTNQAFIGAIDQSGVLQWINTYGGDRGGSFNDLLPLDNCQTLACGYSSSSGGPDWYYLRINPEGDNGGTYTPNPDFVLDTLSLPLIDVPLTTTIRTDTAVRFTPLFEIGVLYDSLTVFSATQPNTICSALGVEDMRAEMNFRVFPNPANGVVQYQIDTPHVLNAATLSIYNLQGVLVRNMALKASEGEISLQGMAAGLYEIRLSSESGFGSQRILIGN